MNKDIPRPAPGICLSQDRAGDNPTMSLSPHHDSQPAASHGTATVAPEPAGTPAPSPAATSDTRRVPAAQAFRALELAAEQELRTLDMPSLTSQPAIDSVALALAWDLGLDGDALNDALQGIPLDSSVTTTR